MIRHITGAAAVLATSALLTAGAASAPAQAATAPTGPRGIRTVDIDGDGRLDRVQLRVVDRTATTQRFLLSVYPAQGTPSGRFIRVPVGPAGYAADQALRGTAPADGTRGNEILVELTGGIRTVDRQFAVFTWRKGALQLLPAGTRTPGPWGLGTVPRSTDGYTVFTKNAVRYLHHHHLVPNRTGSSWAGTRTAYVWKRGQWVRTGTVTVSGLSRSVAERIHGCHGIVWR